jgi:hypothetical protein
MHHVLKYCLGIILLLAGGEAGAAISSGIKSIYLVTAEDERIQVATVAFSETGGKTGYRISWLDEKFDDHFLSMRPFKCLAGAEKLWCRVPYPYDNRREVSVDDLTDLEYDLLFLWKGAGEYGINMWNGVYYRLTLDGERIVGGLHEVDMDILSAPPDDGNLRPLAPADLEESDPDSHWLPRIVIE